MKIPISIAKVFENIAISKHQSALAMVNISSHLNYINYPGLSSYFNRKHEAKLAVSYEIVDYLAVRDHSYNFSKIEATTLSKDRLVNLFEFNLKVEEDSFVAITNAAIQAKDEGDIKSFNYLQELVAANQLDIEDAEGNLAKAKSYETIPGLYYHLDDQLG